MARRSHKPMVLPFGEENNYIYRFFKTVHLLEQLTVCSLFGSLDWCKSNLHTCQNLGLVHTMYFGVLFARFEIGCPEARLFDYFVVFLQPFSIP